MNQFVIQADARCVTREFCTQFDCLLVDPPYSEHVHASATSQSPGRGARHRDFGFEHLDPDLRRAVALAATSVKRWSVIYSDVEGSHNMRVECIKQGAKYIRTLPWVRWSMPQLSGDRPAQGFEHLLVFWGTKTGSKSWNGRGSLVALEHEGVPSEELEAMRSALLAWEVDKADAYAKGAEFYAQQLYDAAKAILDAGQLPRLDHKCLRGETKHKAEKPLDQCLDLVSWFSDPGERVLDLCAGHASIGRACQLLGRGYLGFELSSEWLEKSNKRLASPLSDGEKERVHRWLESKDDVSEQKGPAKVRAERRAADKRLVREVTL